MEFVCNDLTITIYEGEKDSPLILMHEDHNEGERVWKLLAESKCSCTLACISGIKWGHDLAPWDAPANFKKGEPFTGGANEHIDLIAGRIIPEIEAAVGHGFFERYIAGYSLAGLFAMYSVYRTELFAGFVSASGSMWFPNFVEYTNEHTVSDKVRRAYFSIGDKEAKTKNPIMQTVENNTRALAEMISNRGIETKFELNAGGHFVDDDIRLAKGIAWIVGK
ncbi:MAG: alpha/beta hydrolase-fold protein [Eubacteriales bacterium]|nr:alpha/beta hydrolase-fold protein [Eubacteriales bacterium]